MRLTKTITTLLVISLSYAPITFAAKRPVDKNPQIISFDGLDVNSSKGSPRDAYVSTKKSADFEYFFNTKMSFKKKIIDSLERVR